MRVLAPAVVLVLCAALPGRADEPAPKADHTALSKLLHQLAVKRLPKEVEDQSNWGMTIPVPPDLRLPRLRTYVKVGDRVEVPHGPWRRVKGRIEDPARDLVITVRDFRPLDDKKTYRLTVDVDATAWVAGEWQQWQKGLMLVGVDAEADARFAISAVCDVGVTVDLGKFPPAVKLDPTVQDLTVELRDLRFRRGVDGLGDDRTTRLEERLRDILDDVLRAAEPRLKAEANRVLAESLRDGKGLPAGALLLAVPRTPEKK